MTRTVLTRLRIQLAPIEKEALKGFALIEIMLVISIISIIAAIALPRYARYLDSARTTHCLSQRRQIEMSALSAYLTENQAVTTLDSSLTCKSGGTYLWLVSDPEALGYPKLGCSIHFGQIPVPITEEKRGLAMIEGLVATFSMDEGTGSTTSLGNESGQIFGASWTEGKSGSALAFDGKNDYVQADVTDWSGPFTVISWVKALPTGQDQWDSVFASGAKGPNKNNFQIDTDGKGSYRFLGGTGATKLNIGKITSDWQMIAVTFDGANVSTYSNGALTDTGTWKGSGTFTDYVVGRNRNRDRKFGGSVDELGIYQRAVSAEEINAYYQSTK